MLKAKITFGQTALEKSPEGAAYGLALSPPQPCPKHSWQRPGINFCSDLAWYIGPGSVQEQLLSEAREGRAHGGREPQWGQRSISAVPGPARSRLAQSRSHALSFLSQDPSGARWVWKAISDSQTLRCGKGSRLSPRREWTARSHPDGKTFQPALVLQL